MLIDTNVTNGVTLIAEERGRQVAQHGYSLQHDLETYRKTPGNMSVAAVCYATMAGSSDYTRNVLREIKPRFWPWSVEDWKPGADNTHQSRIKELTKAGALIAAEIDRLLGEVHEQEQAKAEESPARPEQQ